MKAMATFSTNIAKPLKLNPLTLKPYSSAAEKKKIKNKRPVSTKKLKKFNKNKFYKKFLRLSLFEGTLFYGRTEIS
jgi:hypothetical protein